VTAFPVHQTAVQRVGHALQRVPAAHRAGLLALQCAGLIRRPRQVARYYRQVPAEKRGVFIGCGPLTLDGWLCTDVVPIRSSIVYLDATKRWPMASESVRYVVCEHMLEQVPYDAGLSVLAEAHRVLVPGGFLRISNASLDVIRLLPDTNDPEAKEYVRWSNRTFGSPSEREEVDNAAHVLNRMMRAFGHKYLYDEATLQWALARAGFRNSVRCEPGNSDHPDLVGVDLHPQLIGHVPNRIEYMIFEATR
jgi:predicted SAM-dependent methyltransferase